MQLQIPRLVMESLCLLKDGYAHTSRNDDGTIDLNALHKAAADALAVVKPVSGRDLQFSLKVAPVGAFWQSLGGGAEHELNALNWDRGA